MTTSKATDRREEWTRQWTFGTHLWTLGEFPKIMGILNVTPDSFSDGGQWSSLEQAVEHGLKLVADGADILDIGGESTRPGAAPVSIEEELQRVIPVIERLSQLTKTPLSIDTRKARVAEDALSAGACIVNDVTALCGDPEMLSACARSTCGVVLMHMQGTPETMQRDPIYTNVVQEVLEYLEERQRIALAAGIAASRILFDPGIGFGKTAEHNLSLMRNVAAFRSGGCPVLIGHSRKRFLSKLVGRPLEERLAGTIGVAIAVAEQHADIIRVHDVAAVRDALLSWHAVRPQETT